MTSQAGNVTTTTTTQSQTASVNPEFGDVSQYRELNAIGTGETDQTSVSQCESVTVLAWARVYYFVTSCNLMN